MSQAIIASNGPVAIPKLRGKAKMPEPTIDPMTIPVSANSGNFCEEFAGTTTSPEVYIICSNIEHFDRTYYWPEV